MGQSPCHISPYKITPKIKNRKYKYGKGVKGLSESCPTICSCVCYAVKTRNFQAMSTAVSLSMMDRKTQLVVIPFTKQLGR